MTEPRQDHQDHVLCLRGLHVHYGSICALRDVTLEKEEKTSAGTVLHMTARDDHDLPMRGKVTARLTGHRDNIALLRKVRDENAEG